jgi:hypothetical protein
MRAHVCFGSFADIGPCPRDVRFAPESEHRVSMDEPPLRVPFERVSPSLSVSVSGKRDFATQRQRRRTGPSRSTDRQHRQSTRTKTHQFGAIRTASGNLCLYGTVVGLRGLELPTKRLSAASPELEQRAACGFSRQRPRSQELWLRRIGYDNGMLSKVIRCPNIARHPR